MREVSILEMLKSGVHFGHRLSKWHPKMQPYIFGARDGIYIIDLEKTAAKLKEATAFLKEVAKKDGKVLFIGTKNQAKEIIRNQASKVNMPYIIERWVGGLFTNWPVISKLIRELKELKKEKEIGGFAKYTKLEQSKLEERITRLEKLVGGIGNLEKLPQAIFMIDTKRGKTALREAKIMKIPVVAIVDTNTNPTGIDYIIPSNDDATKAIELFTSLAAEAIADGFKEKEAPTKEENKKEEKNETVN